MQQLILPITSNNPYHLDDFVVSASNKVAYNTVKNWSKRWGVMPYPFTVLIYGGISSGKTYLSKIWQYLSGAFVITNAQCCRDIIEQYNAFILEDIETWSEELVLYYFNLINEHGKYLLLTTTNITHKYNLPDLSSRIKSLQRVEIKELDDELMRILIFKHFSGHHVEISETVIHFLLTNLSRQFDQIVQSIEKINNFALTYKRRITIPLIKEVLK